MKKKPDFIKDDSRTAALNAIQSHRRRGDSVLIAGDYGIGKSTLLDQIKDPSVIRVYSFESAYQILGRMAGETKATPRAKSAYIDKLKAAPRTVIIDEAQNLPNDIFKFLKQIMDAGNTLILAGLPETRYILKDTHPDVLSRLTTVKLGKLSCEDLYQQCADFEQEAFEIAYGGTNNTRELMTIVKNCRDYATDNQLDRIDIDTVLQFMSE